MPCILRVKRRKSASSEAYWQEFDITPGQADTVASILAGLAARNPLTDREGNITTPISFEKGCGEAKCGACAMVINGKPGLACKTFLRDLGNIVTLEPLSKFPVVTDLIVDRTVIFENLKKMRAYLKERSDCKVSDEIYQSARCMLCGCCMEICPNYDGKYSFVGAAEAVFTYRLLKLESDSSHRHEMESAYLDSYYSKCGESLSCETVCPAGIPVNKILAKANFMCLVKK